MVLFPHAKVNLGLQVIEKRFDGFHNIVSCLYPINWCDVLEILKKPQFKFSTSGLDIPGDPGHNLCVKAYQLIRGRFKIPPVHIHLHKVVPIGAGLGGGSADAAFTLVGLRDMFDLPLSQIELGQLAANLGSDCAFFINSKPSLATGTGDELEPIILSMPDGYLVVVTPPIQVNTGKAYSMLTPNTPSYDLKESLGANLSDWPNLIINDFERPIFEQFPAIAEVKKVLLEHGASFASLSGSGSSVFGIFDEIQPWREWFDKNYMIWEQPI
jgi:4-diphosphocytidyl-2-C-methyl-D-erythritol kinase